MGILGRNEEMREWSKGRNEGSIEMKRRNKDRNPEARKFGRKKHLSEKKATPFHPGSWLKKCDVLVLVWALVAHLSWSIHTRAAMYRVTYSLPKGKALLVSKQFFLLIFLDPSVSTRSCWMHGLHGMYFTAELMLLGGSLSAYAAHWWWVTVAIVIYHLALWWSMIIQLRLL